MSTLPADYVEWLKSQEPKFPPFDHYAWHVERGELSCVLLLLNHPDRESNPATPESIASHVRAAKPYFDALRAHFGDEHYAQHWPDYVRLEATYL